MFSVYHQHCFIIKTVCRLCLFHQYVMELTFSQAAKGVNKEITVNIDATCQRCDGKGHEPGSKIQHCHQCNGTGMVRHAFGSTNSNSTNLSSNHVKLGPELCVPFVLPQETVNTGPFVMRSTCRRCGGRGSVVTSPCTACRGTGQTKQRRTVMVPVPAGESVKHPKPSVQHTAVTE